MPAIVEDYGAALLRVKASQDARDGAGMRKHRARAEQIFSVMDERTKALVARRFANLMTILCGVMA